MRICWLTQFLPSACASGADIASQNLIDALRDLGHEVVVYGYRQHLGQETGPDEVAVGDPRGEASSSGVLAKAGWFFDSLITGQAMFSRKFHSRDYLRSLAANSSKPFDLRIVDHFQLEWLWPKGPTPCIAVAHNVESAIFAQRAKRLGYCMRWLLARESRLLAGSERRIARVARRLWVLTEDDAAVFAGLGARTDVLPIQGEMIRAEASTYCDRNTDFRYDVGLLGLWTWEQNRTGLLWFLREVLPKLPANWRIGIAGKGAVGLTRDPRVSILGFVPSADRFLAECAVQAIPSIDGGGVQIKTINAISSGRPLVVTQVALRGIEGIPDWVQLARTVSEFVESLVMTRGAVVEKNGMGNRQSGIAWQERRRKELQRCLAQSLANSGFLGGPDVQECSSLAQLKPNAMISSVRGGDESPCI